MRRRAFFKSLLGLAALPLGVATLAKTSSAIQLPDTNTSRLITEAMLIAGQKAADPPVLTRHVKKVREFSFVFDED